MKNSWQASSELKVMTNSISKKKGKRGSKGGWLPLGKMEKIATTPQKADPTLSNNNSNRRKKRMKITNKTMRRTMMMTSDYSLTSGEHHNASN